MKKKPPRLPSPFEKYCVANGQVEEETVNPSISVFPAKTQAQKKKSTSTVISSHAGASAAAGTTLFYSGGGCTKINLPRNCIPPLSI